MNDTGSARNGLSRREVLGIGGAALATVVVGGGTAAAASGDVPPEHLAAENARALDQSVQRRAVPLSGLTDWTAAVAMVMATGQSLSDGSEGWPRLTTSARLGTLMLGGCERPRYPNRTTYDVFGAEQLTPAVGAVNKPYQGLNDHLYDDAEVAAFDHADLVDRNARGESGLLAALHQFKRMVLDRHGLPADPARNLLGTNVAFGGQSIEDLATYAGLAGSARSKAAAAAADDALTFQTLAVIHDQGQKNFSNASFDQTRAGFKTKTLDYLDAIRAQVAGAQPADSIPYLVRATGGFHVRDWTPPTGGTTPLDMSIAMAQYEIGRERGRPGKNNTFVSQAAAGVPSRYGGHPTVNGYRWIGCKDGQVLYHVLEEQRHWEPLMPLDDAAYLFGRTIVLPMSVPAPPLAFHDTFTRLTPTTFPDRGFSPVMTGDQSRLAIESIALLDAVVVITLAAEPPAGDLALRYRGQDVFAGAGNLADSDATVAVESYVYDAPAGMLAGENIASLVGHPYPLHNACIPFQVPVIRSHIRGVRSAL